MILKVHESDLIKGNQVEVVYYGYLSILLDKDNRNVLKRLKHGYLSSGSLTSKVPVFDAVCVCCVHNLSQQQKKNKLT